MRIALYYLASLALLCPILADDYITAKISTPEQQGRATWVMELSAKRSDSNGEKHSEYVSVFQTPPHHGAMDKSSASEDEIWQAVSKHWKIRKEEVPAACEILSKFSEWSAVARKNGVRNFTKELGAVGKPPNDTVLIFSVDSVRSELLMKGIKREDFCFSESDASLVASLLSKLPILESQLSQGAKTDSRTALFK